MYTLVFSDLYSILHLSGGPGKIVRVKQVDVIPGSQQKTTSFLIQEQRVGVQAIRGTQKQGYTASLQQFWHRENDKQTDACRDKEINALQQYNKFV